MRKQRLRAMLCAALCTVFFAGTAQAGVDSLASDLIGSKDGFSAVLYDNRNGLPVASVNDIAQTEDGFLWIGSYAGLIRYDGRTFERIDSTGGLTSAKCLFVDSRGRLWAGTNDNGAALVEHGGYCMWGKGEGLTSLHIRMIAEDGEGLIYLATSSGIAVIDRNNNLRMMPEEEIFEADVECLRAGPDGTLYGMTATGDLIIIREGRLQRFLPAGEITIGSTRSVFPDLKTPGILYMEGADFGLYRVDVQDGFQVLSRTDMDPLRYVEDMEWIDGRLWICAGNGIGVLENGTFHALTNLPMSNNMNHAMADYQNNLWFSSSRQGLMKVVPNRFTDLFARYGLPETVVNAVCLLDNHLFVATDEGLLVLTEDGPLERLPLSAAQTASGKALDAEDLIAFLKGARIRSVIRDSRDRVWISTWRSKGLLRYDHGELIAFTEEDGLLSGNVRAVAEQKDGSMLVALSGGVNVIKDRQVIAAYGVESGITNTASLTVCEGLKGEIVLGTNGGGLYLIRDSEIRKLDVEDGLPSDIVMRIVRDEEHQLLWLVTGNAIAYMTADGKITAVRNFPYSDNLDLILMGNGKMWVLSSNGIYVVSAEEMIANEEIHPLWYGVGSGLPYLTTSNSYSELTEGGDLYLAGTAGVCRINVNQPGEETVNLKIAVPYAMLDGKYAEPDKAGGFTVPFSVRKVTIYPRVFSYSLQEPRVSLRLEGFEEEETVFSRDDLEPLTWTNLPVGSYRFTMRVEVDSGAAVSLEVPIVKEEPLTEAQSGTVIMDLASLLFLAGILIYSATYMRRNRLDDWMFRYMAWANITLDVTELFIYVWEAKLIGEMRPLAWICYTAMYLSLSLFMYFFVLHLYFRVHQDENRKIRKRTLFLYGLPMTALILLLLCNIGTGWVFSLGVHQFFVPGPIRDAAFVPIFLYLALAVPLTWKVNRRLVALGFLLLLIRIAWLIWLPEIASVSMMYTLLLICAYAHQMNRAILEEMI